MKVEIKGIDELRKQLQKLAKEKPENVKKLVAGAALAIEGSAVQRAPVDTGNLKSSMGIRFDNDGMSAEIFNSSSYAPHVEWGTHKAASQSFLNPSFEQHKGTFVDNIKNELKKI